MKKLFVLGLASLAAACSSTPPDPFGPPPNFAAINAEFQHPTGTFAAGTESSVLSSYRSQSSNAGVASGLFPEGAGGTTTKSVGVRPLAGQATSFCTPGAMGSGSCGCPGGGTIQWDFSASAQPGGGQVILKLLATGCKSSDGATSLDGKAFLDVQASNVQTTSSADGGETTTGNVLMIYDAHFAYVSGGTSGNIAMDFEDTTIGGESTFGYLVTVPDGTVVVGGSWDDTSKTGNVVVVDNATTWKCAGTDGKTITCTSSAGATRTATL